MSLCDAINDSGQAIMRQMARRYMVLGSGQGTVPEVKSCASMCQCNLARVSYVLGFVMVFTHICRADGGTPQLLNCPLQQARRWVKNIFSRDWPQLYQESTPRQNVRRELSKQESRFGVCASMCFASQQRRDVLGSG